MYYAWHSRDHVKKILIDECQLSAQSVGTLLNTHIRESRDLQICSYLANEYKHAGVDDSQKWAIELAPRYGDIYVFGVMTGFPWQMKPTIMFTSKEPQFELTGFAQVDDQQFPFVGYDWTVSCVVEDKDGNVLGDAISICERAFQTWLLILRQHGLQLPFDDPMRASVDGLLISLGRK
jgi:hypothetical protein